MPRSTRSSKKGAKTPNNASSCGNEGRSILKRRTRKPLQEVVDLHLTEEPNVSRPSSRRVSFAVSEVKEFCQPANEGTLWGNSYTLEIQKSSSESENTGSSSSDFRTFSSGSCGPGLYYSQQTIVQETVSVSYFSEEEDEEDANKECEQISGNQHHHVRELVDHAIQTDESIFQQIENSRNCDEENIKENDPEHCLKIVNENNIFDPAHALGEYVQSRSNSKNPTAGEVSEYQAVSKNSSKSRSLKKSYSDYQISLGNDRNVMNEDPNSHEQKLRRPPQKHPSSSSSSLDEDSIAAKKKRNENEARRISLQEWLKGDSKQDSGFAKQMQNERGDNQMHSSKWNSNVWDDDDDCEVIRPCTLQRKNCDDTTNSFSVQRSDLLSTPRLNFQGENITEVLPFDNEYELTNLSGDTSVCSNSSVNRRKRFENLESQGVRLHNDCNTSNTEADMSFTITDGRLLNALPEIHEDVPDRVLDGLSTPCRNIHSPKKFKVTQRTEDYSEVENAGHCIDSLQATRANWSSCQMKASVTENVSPKMIEDNRNGGDTNCASPLANHTAVSVSPTVVGGRILDQTDYADISGRSVSPLMMKERILNNDQAFLKNIYYGADIAENASLTIANRRILDNYGEKCPGFSNFRPRTLPPTTDTHSVDQSSPSLTHVSGTSMSPTLAAGRILDGKSFMNHSDFRPLSENNVSLKSPERVFDLNQPYGNFISAKENNVGRKSVENDRAFSNPSSSSLESNKRIIVPQTSMGRRNLFNESISDHIDSANLNVRNSSSAKQDNILNVQDLSLVLQSIKVSDQSNSPTKEKEKNKVTDKVPYRINSANVSDINVSQTLAGGQILTENEVSNQNSSFRNVSGKSVSSTTSGGEILNDDQNPSNHIHRSMSLSGISLSPTIAGGRILSEDKAGSNYIPSFGCASSNISPTIAGGKILIGSPPSVGHLFKSVNVSGQSLSPTIAGGRILLNSSTSSGDCASFVKVNKNDDLSMNLKSRVLDYEPPNLLASFRPLDVSVTPAKTVNGDRVLEQKPHSTTSSVAERLSPMKVEGSLDNINIIGSNSHEIANTSYLTPSTCTLELNDDCVGKKSFADNKADDVSLEASGRNNIHNKVDSLKAANYSSSESMSDKCVPLTDARVFEAHQLSTDQTEMVDSNKQCSQNHSSTLVENSCRTAVNSATTNLILNCDNLLERQRAELQGKSLKNNCAIVTPMSSLEIETTGREAESRHKNCPSDGLDVICNDVSQDSNQKIMCDNMIPSSCESKTGEFDASNSIMSHTIDKMKNLRTDNKFVDIDTEASLYDIPHDKRMNDVANREQNVIDLKVGGDLNVEEGSIVGCSVMGSSIIVDTIENSNSTRKCSSNEAMELEAKPERETSPINGFPSSNGGESNVENGKCADEDQAECVRGSEMERRDSNKHSVNNIRKCCSPSSKMKHSVSTKFQINNDSSSVQPNNQKDDDICEGIDYNTNKDNMYWNDVNITENEETDEIIADVILEPPVLPICFQRITSTTGEERNLEVTTTGKVLIAKPKDNKNTADLKTVTSKDGIFGCNNEYEHKSEQMSLNLNISINKGEERNRKVTKKKCLPSLNTPAICVSGIDFIDWQSSSTTDSEVECEKDIPIIEHSVTNNSVSGPSLDVEKQSAETDRIEKKELEVDESASSLASSISSYHSFPEGDFEEADENIIKSFRSLGQEDLMKERGLNSLSLRNNGTSIAESITLHEANSEIVTPVEFLETSLQQSELPGDKLITAGKLNKTCTEKEEKHSANTPPIQTGSSFCAVDTLLKLKDAPVENLTPKSAGDVSVMLYLPDNFEDASDITGNFPKAIKKCEVNDNCSLKKKQELHRLPESVKKTAGDDMEIDFDQSKFNLRKEDTLKESGLHSLSFKNNDMLNGESSSPHKADCEKIALAKFSKAPVQQIEASGSELFTLGKSNKNCTERTVQNSEELSPMQTESSFCRIGTLSELKDYAMKSPTPKSTCLPDSSEADSAKISKNFTKAVRKQTGENLSLQTNQEPQKLPESVNRCARDDMEINVDESKFSINSKCTSLNSSENCRNKSRPSEFVSPVPKKKAKLFPKISYQSFLPDSSSLKENFQTLSSQSRIENYSLSVSPDCCNIRKFTEDGQQGCVETWIQSEQKSENCAWRAEILSPENIKFYFLEKNLILFVKLDPCNCNIKDVELVSLLKGSQMKTFMNDLFLRRLNLKTLKDRYPHKESIPALVNFVTEQTDFLSEFSQVWLDLEVLHNVKMRESSCVEMEVISMALLWIFIIKINLSAWNGERLHSRHVEVISLMGEVNEAEIKRLVRAIPGGPHFLKEYIDHLYCYIRTKEKLEGDPSLLENV